MSSAIAAPIKSRLADNYFDCGDTVEPRRISGPKMVVRDKKFSDDPEKVQQERGWHSNSHRGQKSTRRCEMVECFWFTTEGNYCIATFDPRDLIIVERAIPEENRRNS